LSEDGLGLDADSLDAVHDYEGSISDAQGGCDFGGEVHVAWRVYEVYQILIAISFALTEGKWRKLKGSW